MKFPFQTIALIGKYKTPGISEPLLQLAGFLTEKGLSVVMDKLTAEHLGRAHSHGTGLPHLHRHVDGGAAAGYVARAAA